MGEVKVIGTWSSPFVKRVEMALKIKGVEYEYIEESIRNKSALLLQHNPIHKKVPILLHNGKPILESMVILEYIDEVWEGPPILPRDPYERAMARFWHKFINDECADKMWNACWSTGEEREKLKQEAMKALEILENEIKGNKFFGGDKIGVVDHTANSIAYWIPIAANFVGLELMNDEKFPNLCRWADDYNNDTFVKENLPNKDDCIALMKKM
ncbi:glutathione S-transferase TAU 8 [Perilla frutescens var. hirtella]|uniref:Probable glutathione S-transferase n=1 Tax=Perilla frutescens var. hirtella TaxID=608512 RepID=A0AAD4J0S7_PERFH|nr:glutathione S-transferase TAU 8 [Perilla frutescens var. hirtella]